MPRQADNADARASAAAPAPTATSSSADSWTVDVGGGAAAGCVGVFAAQPLDFAKVRMQVGSSHLLPPSDRGGVGRFLLRTARAEGMRAWYKGMAVPLASQLVIQGTVFGVFGAVHRELARVRWRSGGGPDHAALFAAGSTAGLVQSPLMTAVERVKIKLQVQRSDGGAARGGGGRYAGPVDCAAQLLKRGGLRSLFAGFAPTVCREVPSYGLYFMAYEDLKHRWRDAETGKTGPLSLLLAGGLAGCFALGCVHPFDVLKTTVQATSSSRAQPQLPHQLLLAGRAQQKVQRGGAWRNSSTSSRPRPASSTSTSMWGVAQQQYQQHGWRFFTRGFVAQQQHAFLINAVIFVAYERAADMMRAALDGEQ